MLIGIHVLFPSAVLKKCISKSVKLLLPKYLTLIFYVLSFLPLNVVNLNEILLINFTNFLSSLLSQHPFLCSGGILTGPCFGANAW